MRLDPLIEGDDSVQRHVASEREKQALLAVSPMARRAIQREILPQIEESVISEDSVDDLGDSTKRSIEAAFSFKNELYTRLIQYKGIDQSDDQFLEDLLLVMDEWVRGAKARFKEEADAASEAEETKEKREVEIKVKIETDTEQGLEGREPEEVPISVADVFDLADVRV